MSNALIKSKNTLVTQSFLSRASLIIVVINNIAIVLVYPFWNQTDLDVAAYNTPSALKF